MSYGEPIMENFHPYLKEALQSLCTFFPGKDQKIMNKTSTFELSNSTANGTTRESFDTGKYFSGIE
ncbi:hypothetical protein ACHAPF_000799 [Botrytis cinerea]